MQNHLSIAVRSADPAVDFPGWLEFDADRLLLSGRPEDADTGLVALEVVVTDNNGSGVCGEFYDRCAEYQSVAQH